MSDVSMWRLFAFMHAEDQTRDETRTVAEWQLQDTIRWCVTRGYDTIYLHRDPVATARFTKKPPPDGVKHQLDPVEFPPMRAEAPVHLADDAVVDGG